MYTKEILEKLSIEDLKEILKKLNINISSVLSKENMILLILDNQNNNIDQKINDQKINENDKGIQFDNEVSQKLKPNGVGLAGAIINIIFASLAMIPLFIWMVIFSIFFFPIAIPFIIFFIIQILSLAFNISYLNGKHKVTAGIFGLFSSLIGGILVLASKLEKK